MKTVFKSMKWLSLILLLLSNICIGQSDSLTLPYLKVCEGKDRPDHCTEGRLSMYFDAKLKYPKAAEAAKIEGVVKVSFIINQDGRIINPVITQDIGNGCGEEVLRLFEHLKSSKIQWVAGTENERKVCFLVKDYEVYFDLELVERTVPTLNFTVNPQRIIRNISFKRQKKQTKKTEIITEKDVAEEEFKPIVEEKIVEDDLRIYEQVDKNPIFPGCLNGGVYNDTLRADDCSAYFLQRYLDLRQYIQYPQRAFENGIEGVVKISYVVEKDGSMSNIYCITDIGADCGKAVVEAFQRMKITNFKWYPAIYKNEAVRVSQTFEYRFSLANEKARRAARGF